MLLEALALNFDSFFPIAILIPLISLFGSKIISGKFSSFPIPVIFSLSSILLLYLIDSPLQKQVFILLSAMIYYLCFLGLYRLKKYEGDLTARGMLGASATAAIFFFYSSFYGIYINFPIPLWILMIVFLLATFLISLEYLLTIRKNKKDSLTYSLILGIVMAQVSWVINFWPFGYLTTGVIALIFYYVFMDLIQGYFLNFLSKKRLVMNLILFSFLIFLILATSKWLPVV